MSTFDFLKKDLEQKIVKTQGWELLSHKQPHNPQMTPYHLHSWFIVQDRTIYSWIFTRQCGVPTHFAFLYALVRLSSILVQERKYPFLGTPEMSDKSRYEWRLYLHPLHRPFAFWHPYFLSWTTTQERKLYTRIIPPFGELQKWVTNWDMSDKSF